jgi:hypothetical protein
LDWGTLTLSFSSDGKFTEGSMTAAWATGSMKVTKVGE